MAATRLSSISKIKPSFLINSLRLNPVNAGLESTLRTFDFPIIGASIEKPHFQTLDHPIFIGSTLADRFRIDVRGDPVKISDGEEDEFGDDANVDEFDDDDNVSEVDDEECSDDDDAECSDDDEKK